MIVKTHHTKGLKRDIEEGDHSILRRDNYWYLGEKQLRKVLKNEKDQV